jgi:hypothetical protein
MIRFRHLESRDRASGHIPPDEPVGDPTTFTKTRDPLLNGEVFTKFMAKLPFRTIPGQATVGRAFFGGWN